MAFVAVFGYTFICRYIQEVGLKSKSGKRVELGSLRKILIKLLPIVDLLISPLTMLSAALLFFIRRVGIGRMHISKKIFIMVGVFPIRDHYYEPLFNPKYLTKPLSEERIIPGFDLNVSEQLNVLEKFNFNDELAEFTLEKVKELEYYYHNESFGPGDAEYLYNIVRSYKPNRIVEIGSGNSTLVAVEAIKRNRKDNPGYSCSHVCIEPYEAGWLEKLDVKVIRQRVERIDKQVFSDLQANDILFIDSSHVIRPQGDVLFEFLEILPVLHSGVLIHIHDIYTPRDYPEVCILEDVRFWNEQYLLEAFLTLNSDFRVIGALNHLKHHYFAELSSKCPVLGKENQREPASFWMVKK